MVCYIVEYVTKKHFPQMVQILSDLFFIPKQEEGISSSQICGLVILPPDGSNIQQYVINSCIRSAIFLNEL